MVFFGRPRSEAAAYAVESPRLMTGVLAVLALLSLTGGFLNTPWLHILGKWLEHTLHEVETLPFDPLVAGLSTAVGLGAIGLAWVTYRSTFAWAHWEQDPLHRLLKGLFDFLQASWHWDDLYQVVFVRGYRALAGFLAFAVDWTFWHDWFHDVIVAGGFRRFSRFLSQPVDLGVVDGLANGLGHSIQGLALVMRRWQSGYVRNYALAVMLGVVSMMVYILWALR